MSTTLPPIRKRPTKPADDDAHAASKKRRLTHSPHPLRTDLDSITPAPAKQSSSTPISPIGFTVQRDLADHVRSVKQIRKKQEALIEQRRGSVGALGPDDPSSAPPACQEQPLPPTPLSVAATQPTSGPSSSRLPPPPISFANRAINAGKKKPADLLLVNPRDPPFHSSPNPTRHLARGPAFSHPSVQSAPPSQNAFSIPMALPRLPSNIISAPAPAIAGSRRVPPTPTRLSMQPNSGSSGASVANGKSPPASIPIATTLVPHTPTSLAINRAVNLGNSLLHPPSIILSSPSNSPATPLASAQSQASPKQAFLAPFELFYDALQDAKQLKEWLNEQLTKTAALTRRWEDEVARLESERAERASTGVARVKREEGESETSLGSGADLREELEWLKRRVDELEGRFGSVAVNPSGTGTTATASSSSSTSSNEGYTFPQHPQQRYEQQYEVMRRQRESAVSTATTLQPLPAISRRLSLSGRPELERRLSSPGRHPSSASSSPSISTVRGYRVVGKTGLDGERDDDRHEGGHGVGMSMSKSLSGPGTCGTGFSSSGGSGLKRKGRRVSISGGVLPGAKERAEREDGPGVEERQERVPEGEGEGSMNVDSVGGVEEGKAPDSGSGEQEQEREADRDRGRE